MNLFSPEVTHIAMAWADLFAEGLATMLSFIEFSRDCASGKSLAKPALKDEVCKWEIGYKVNFKRV